MNYPASELDHWSAFFSINDNKDKPILPRRDPNSITIKESIEQFKQVMG